MRAISPRIIGIIFICITLIFFVASLLTYNPCDSSLFYVSSKATDVRNICGLPGAYCAALLFFFFGGAAFLCVIPFLFLMYVIIKKLPFCQHWERLAAVVYGIIICATLSAIYMIDYACPASPGGFIGLLCTRWLYTYCDGMGRILFLYTHLLASFIVFWRFAYMNIMVKLIYLVKTFIAYMQQRRVIQRCAAFAMIVCHYSIARPMKSFCVFVKSLYDGSAFEGTDLLLPHSENEELIVMDYDHDDNEFHDQEPLVVQESSDIEDTQEEVVKKTVPYYEAHVKNVYQKESLYELPVLDIFVYEKNEKNDSDLHAELQSRATILQDKLKRFGVSGEVVAIKRGPVVTLFEYQPEIDTKLSKIIALEDDLAMALQAMSIRILAPIPGRSVVGFEVANSKRHDVLFSQVVTSSVYKDFQGSLPLILGKDTIGDPVVVDLARMPHLLIAGSTGSGKSVALNALLVSLLCALSPDDLKLILIDPKRLEFAAFTDIAHLLFPIVTSPHYAAPVLRWVVQEMERRYEKMAEKGARNCIDYNNLRDKNSEEHEHFPFIVVVIDELADLMITVGRDVEDLITRITQMARAAGIHMIVATQRPSVDVITGLIKANFPSRISFRVASKIDSRTILDTGGADRLLSRGDMLFLDASKSELRRVHGAYVSDQEIDQVMDYIRAQKKVEYLDIHKEMSDCSNALKIEDPLYNEVRLFLEEIDEISISLVQRKFRIGYNRSARIIDVLESQGLIMPQDGGKMRKVIR